ncbi:ultraviolet-B receptor UVR8 [Magnolia sinica]|uniref:ultraviolet-B receptor UVR8 n=1 Tax=Magnolia sinica TaxID=86752 RepID=UPI002658CF99|nr:ultraviolet-B receptor UVR8 [Magnolia sinica]XP_058082039.1 ultraviolet-B receptor UVR8 [Magnolia sinica]XP_058082040.1 ultraviolet-B receptor UVR8 [Magnolia sinica]
MLVRRGRSFCNLVSSSRSFTCSRALRSDVLSFGDSSHGALGFGGGDAYEPTCIPDLPPDISAIAAGHYHSLAVTHGGEVWAWGRDQEGQLGRGLPSPRDSWNQPKRVEGLEQVRVRAAFASGVISSAIGDDGSLWVWGKSKRGQLGLGKGVTEAMVPSRVEALAGEEIVKVALGWGHALAQTRNGKLFGWGYASEGRLGQLGESLETSFSSSITSRTNGDSSSMLEVAEKMVLEGIEKEKNMPIIWEPLLVQELHGCKVSDVACGLDHSLVICCDGTLLSGGSNIYGQLGRVTEGSKMLPVNISFEPISISSGLGHSLAVCQIPSPEVAGEATSVLTWGWNLTSQLGRQGPENFPALVHMLDGERPVSVSGGRAHSIVLTSKREVWAWGSGRNGRLGLGSSVDEAEPALVDCLTGFEVQQVVAGFDHTLVLSD